MTRSLSLWGTVGGGFCRVRAVLTLAWKAQYTELHGATRPQALRQLNVQLLGFFRI